MRSNALLLQGCHCHRRWKWFGQGPLLITLAKQSIAATFLCTAIGSDHEETQLTASSRNMPFFLRQGERRPIFSLLSVGPLICMRLCLVTKAPQKGSSFHNSQREPVVLWGGVAEEARGGGWGILLGFLSYRTGGGIFQRWLGDLEVILGGSWGGIFEGLF